MRCVVSACIGDLETGLLSKPKPHHTGEAGWPASSQALLVSTLPIPVLGGAWLYLSGFFHGGGNCTQVLTLAYQALLPTEPLPY